MSPTITVASFFSFFFVRPQNVCVVDTFYRTTKVLDRQTGSAFKIVQRVPPFSYSIFIVRYKTGRDYRVPPLSFFGTVRLFFDFFCLQRVPPSNFLIFYSKLKFQKVQRVSPFKFFGTMRLAQNSYSSIFRFFRNFFYLMSQKVPPFNFLKYFAT